jgi:hypothetical protein
VDPLRDLVRAGLPGPVLQVHLQVRDPLRDLYRLRW